LKPKALGLDVTGDAGPRGPYSTVSNYEGQLKAQVLFNPQNPALTAGFVISLIKTTLATYGELKAIHSISCGIPHVKAYSIEFYDTRSVADAYVALNNNKDIGVSSLTITFRTRLLTRSFCSMTLASSLSPIVTMLPIRMLRTSVAAMLSSQVLPVVPLFQ
jgi:hypothetical protein